MDLPKEQGPPGYQDIFLDTLVSPKIHIHKCEACRVHRKTAQSVKLTCLMAMYPALVVPTVTGLIIWICKLIDH